MKFWMTWHRVERRNSPEEMARNIKRSPGRFRAPANVLCPSSDDLEHVGLTVSGGSGSFMV